MRPSSYASDSHVKPNWSVLRSLVPYLLEFKGRVLVALGLLIIAKIVSVATPWVLKLLVDSLDAQKAAIAAPLALVAAYGFFRFMSAFLSELRDTVFARVTERAMRRVAKRVLEHLHKLDLEFHLSRKTGGLSRDIERGTSGINFLLRFLVFNIVPTFLELLMVLVVLWGFFHWYYCLVVVCVIVLYVGFSVVVTEWRTQYVRAVNECDSRSNSRAVDSLLNYETVKYFNNEEYEVARYDEALSLWEAARIRIRFTLTFLNSGQAFIIALSMTIMLMMAAHEVVENTMTLGDFVMINAYMIQLFIPLNFLGFVYREIRQALINVESMFALMRIAPVVESPKNSADLKSLDVTSGCRIEFRNVHFSYHVKSSEAREIIKGVSFEIQPGQKVAVVGASGAGKSTLAKLLFRFYDPTAGQILINGVDIRCLTVDDLRSHIGVVPQDTVLFNDTILHNIAYGRPSCDRSDVDSAVEGANLREFIDLLPNGLETMVGERGLKLSGGEKQRVAIARVLLKRPAILIFDEATSSLDTQSEQYISQALDRLSKKHSTLVIAHRLSTIMNADRIIVLKDGACVEEGSHSRLLENRQYYYELWQAQSREAVAASKD